MAEQVTSPHGQLWTSAEVARAFRVGVSSVKRWTDEGELESIRTPGGHRRYALAAIYRFASIRNLPTTHLPRLEQTDFFEELPEPADVSLYDALASGDTLAVRQLVTPKVENIVQRASFLDRVVGDALREIGFRWSREELTVDQEHRATHIITESLDRLRPIPRRDGPLAILACPPGEWHELPLHLVRLVFEWSGWRTDLVGAQLPWSASRSCIERARPAILGFSARTAEPFHHEEFERLATWAREQGTTVITGGEWARGGSGSGKDYLRFRTLRGFEKWLRGAEVAKRAAVPGSLARRESAGASM